MVAEDMVDLMTATLAEEVVVEDMILTIPEIPDMVETATVVIIILDALQRILITLAEDMVEDLTIVISHHVMAMMCQTDHLVAGIMMKRKKLNHQQQPEQQLL